jgi:transposase-like protein
VKGRWKYLYRAIDKDGATLDFFLADRRNTKAAKRFLGAALRRSRAWTLRVINTDKNPAYGEAIAELKKEGAIPKELEHRQAEYLNNRLESDHGKLGAIRLHALRVPAVALMGGSISTAQLELLAHTLRQGTLSIYLINI